MRHLTLLCALLAGSAGIAWPAAVPAAKGWNGNAAISPVCQPDPTRGSQLNDVAVNASGLVIAAWDQYTYTTGGPYTIGVAVQSGGKWSPPFTISGTTGFSMSPKVAAGADGTLAVSWVYEDPSLTQKAIQVAIRPAGSSTWTTSTLAFSTLGGVSMTDSVPIGIDAAGNVTAAWQMWDGTRNVVQAATMPKGGMWQAAVTLSGGTTSALYPSLAVNARGDAAVAYSISPYSPSPSGTWAEYVFRSGPSGAWKAPVQISEIIPSTTGYVTSPLVALDGNGLATVLYFGYGIEGVRQTAQAAWTNPATVLQAPNSVSSYVTFDLALDASGNAVAAASIFDATVGVDRASVYVARGKANGTWTAQVRLTNPSVPVDAYATRAAISPDGKLAMVGWIDHYHQTVQASQLTAAGWGAATTIGRKTAWSSFQEVLSLDIGSSAIARAVWKNATGGTQTMAASYGQ